MKVSQVLCALLLSSLLITSRAASGLTINAYTTGTTADSSQYSSASTYQVNSGTATAFTSSQITTAATIATGVVLTVKFAATPLISNFQYENDGAASGTAAINYQVNLNLGNQVAVTVSATAVSTPGSSAGTITVGSGATLAASATAVTPSSACGTYYVDCGAGVVYFSLATAIPGAAGSNTYCTVQINQIAAIVGVLQFPTASVPTTSAVQSTIAGLNSLTSAVTTVCGTSTSGTNTLYYFISTYGTSTSSSDQTTNANKIKTAASTMGINSNTAYYVNQLATNAAGTTTAPSATASANLTTASKSAHKFVVFAGIMTTIVAAVFGFAL